jgi:glutaredoxin
MFSVRSTALAAVAGAALWSAVAHAQVYRIVGPDGKVTFSDRPPVNAPAQPAQSVPLNTVASPASSLPSELRRVTGQYPVTLYTGDGCDPCGAARRYLQQRGIPFTERTVNTREDIAALQRLAGAASLPFVTIGGQHIPGFSDAEWSQYLDAAGYPRSSQLPIGYRNPDATPLVAIQRPSATPRTAQGQQPPQSAEVTPPAAPSGPAPSNPAGIRF